MMWTSRNRIFRSSFSSHHSRRAFLSTLSSMEKRRARYSSSHLATLLILGTAVGGASSFYFSGVSSSSRYSASTNSPDLHHSHNNANHYLIATSASNNNASPEIIVPTLSQKDTRSYTTKADQYFQKWHAIPLPSIMHDDLERLLSEEKDSAVTSSTTKNNKDSRSIIPSNNRILVIGDVHGCLDELKNLVQKATNENNHGKQFAAIVLVGDLCNKGPSSAEVVHYIRNQPNWFTIRGNHDDAALSAALGDEDRCSKARYQWVNELSDEDVAWMSNLPYTISIPKSMLNDDANNNEDDATMQDVIIVHAGLDPSIDLKNQETKTMITVRNLMVNEKSQAWALTWPGPELIIFGHDAKRGLQQEEHAIGLDSGCVYGKKLTGIILPERKLVSVDAVRDHCPIKKKS